MPFRVTFFVFYNILPLLCTSSFKHKNDTLTIAHYKEQHCQFNPNYLVLVICLKLKPLKLMIRDVM